MCGVVHVTRHRVAGQASTVRNVKSVLKSVCELDSSTAPLLNSLITADLPTLLGEISEFVSRTHSMIGFLHRVSIQVEELEDQSAGFLKILLATCYLLLTVYFLLLATCYLLLNTYHSLPTTYYLLLTVYFLLLTTYYLLLTTYYLLLTTYYLLLTTYYLLLTTYYLLLTTYYLLLTTYDLGFLKIQNSVENFAVRSARLEPTLTPPRLAPFGRARCALS